MKNYYYLLLSAVLAMMSSATWAQTFTVDDLSFTVTDAEAKTVSVRKSPTTTGDVVIPSSVTNEEETYTVTAIPENGFASTGITSITIPASVLSVGGQAFNDCDALTAITIEDSETPLGWYGGYYQPLWGVDADYTLYLGRDLTTDDNRCYFGRATSVEIGDMVTTINSNLFDGASRLASVTMGTGVTTIGAYAFQYTGTDDSVGEQSISLGANVETIGGYAFRGCTKLTTLDLGSTLTAIPEVMLAGCTALTSITIPASVLSVGGQSFDNCDALTSIIIEDSETPLAWNGNYWQPLWAVDANYTLYLGRDLTPEDNRCYFAGATSVEIGPKVTTINNNLFDGATKLASVTIGDGVTTIGAYAFQNTGKDDNIGEQSISLGANVETIGNRAFYGCTKLTSLDLGTKLTAIPENMLVDCIALTSITIPASVQSVGATAFNNCDALTSITIEDSETPLAWNGGYYQPLWDVNSNYTLYLGRDLTVEDNRCYFWGATEVEAGPKVTTINPHLFNGAPSLASVTMGEGVITIGEYAFCNTGSDDSVGEQSISLGANVETIGSYAFNGCTKLTTLDLGTTLTAISDNMFVGCTALTGITIPASVQSVGVTAFNNCDALTSIIIEDSETPLAWNGGYYQPLWDVNSNYTLYLGRDLTTEGDQCYFWGATEVEVGPMVTTINPSLFSGAPSLASVTMGEGVTTIGAYAFQNSGTDDSVGEQFFSLGANVDSIAIYAFRGCTKLTSIDLGTKLTKIPEFMLAGCTALSSITIPASVLTVCYQAFDNCDALTSITIEDSETPLEWKGGYYQPLWASDANYSLYLGRDLTPEDNRCYFAGATSVEVGPKVTTINDKLFQGSASLADIDLTSATSLTTIGSYAFDGAGNGDSVSELNVAFGNSVTTIGARAFNNCDKISYISIPANVTTIESNAFWNMGADITVIIEDSETPLTLNCADSYYAIFEDNPSITAYVGRNILRTGNYANKSLFDGQLTSVTIGPMVTAIGDSEYNDCDGLPTVSGMENVESIGARAFKSCSNLTSIELGTKLATMGDYAFQDCQKLESIVIPGTLKVIPVEAFENCFALAEVTLCEGIEEIGNGAFFDTDALTEIIIPASVKKIGRAPFYCNNTQVMKRMIIADSDEPLEFANGTSEYNWGRGNLTDNITLDYFYLGRDVNRVYFEHSLVYGAKEIEIGPKVTTISETKGLFYAPLDVVERVKVHHLTPIAINDADFSASIYANATLLVPAGTTEAYAAADGWKKFTNRDYWSTLVTLTASAHGSIVTAEATVSNGSEQFHQAKDDAVVYTLNADNGYELTALTDNDVAVSPLPALGAAQTRANAYGEEFITLDATFAPITYTITYDLAGGAAADGLPESYTIESETFTLAQPTREGHIFTGWTGTGLTEATTTVTIANGSTGDRSYTATWLKEKYTVNITGNGVMADNMTPEYGDDVVLTIMAFEDYRLECLTVNGVDVTNDVVDDKYTIVNVNADVIVTASFIPTKEYITLAQAQTTFSCTQGLDFTGIEDLKVYVVSGYDNTTGNVLMTQVEGAVPANTGLFLVGTEGVTYKVPYVTIDAEYENLLKPVTAAQVVPMTEGDYTNFLYSEEYGVNGFYRISGEETVAAGKAYLQLPTSDVTDVEFIGLLFDIETAISSVKGDALAPEGVFDINGRKLPAGQKLTRGIYVINGKKVAVK